MGQAVRHDPAEVAIAIISLRVKLRYTNMPVLHTNMQGQITPTVITTLLTHYTNRHHQLPVSTSRLTNHCHHVSVSTLGPQQEMGLSTHVLGLYLPSTSYYI